MTDNTIFNDATNNSIGFYEDMKRMLQGQAEEFIKSENWEMAKDVADVLLDLNAYADNESLLTLSDNNGMGYTIKEYEKGD